MFIQRTSGRVSVWYVAFSPRVPSPFWNWAIPGHWKHVCAFGHCESAGTWIFIDPDGKGTKVAVVPDHEAPKYISDAAAEGAVLRISARELPGPHMRIIGCCTMTVRHLVGLPGRGLLSAVPDRLFADCLRAGAEVFYPRP